MCSLGTVPGPMVPQVCNLKAQSKARKGQQSSKNNIQERAKPKGRWKQDFKSFSYGTQEKHILIPQQEVGTADLNCPRRKLAKHLAL